MMQSKSNLKYSTTFFVILFFTLSILSTAQKQGDDYFDQNFIRYDNHNYRESIKTVQVYRIGWEDSYPVIELEANDQLVLNFDDLSGELSNFAYSFIHCNADWEPSDLMEMEYTSGVFENFVLDYNYSRTQRQKYIHYRVTFPNEDIQLTRSGNYIIKIYDLDHENELVLTRRFFVAETKIGILPNIKQASKVADRRFRHEIDFSIVENQLKIINPYQNLKVALVRNQDWNHAITGLQPTFSKGTEYVYNYDEENVFDAGNEFRFFDVRTFGYTALETESVDISSDTISVELENDEARGYKVYVDQPDINGRYLIHTDDSDENDIDAEYALVHFKLPYPNPITNGDLFIYGEISNWRYGPEYKMEWNQSKRRYENLLYIKQGYYNYLYAYRKDGQDKPDFTLIEGTHAQTENEYTIMVYYKQPQDIYDRLIGFRTFQFPKR